MKAGAHSQNVGTDGAIRRLDLITLAPRQAVECAELLVEVGLWHRPGHDCEQCPPLPDGVAYLFHDWFQMRYTPPRMSARTGASARSCSPAARGAGVSAGLCRSGEPDDRQVPLLRKTPQTPGPSVADEHADH